MGGGTWNAWQGRHCCDLRNPLSPPTHCPFPTSWVWVALVGRELCPGRDQISWTKEMSLSCYVCVDSQWLVLCLSSKLEAACL